MPDEPTQSSSPPSVGKAGRRNVPPVLKDLDRAMSRTVDAWTRWKKAAPENTDAARKVIEEAEGRLKEAWTRFDQESQAWQKTAGPGSDDE